MLSVEELKFAVEDAQKRHQAVLDLIDAGDRQALGLLQLYIALAGTSLSGSAVILLSATNTMPRPLGVGLAGFGVMMAVGAICALITLWPSDVRLSGNTPDFWQWANRADVGMERALRSYLERLADAIAINRQTNRRQATSMFVSKCAGAFSPLIAASWGTIVQIYGA